MKENLELLKKLIVKPRINCEMTRKNKLWLRRDRQRYPTAAKKVKLNRQFFTPIIVYKWKHNSVDTNMPKFKRFTRRR